MAKFNIDSFLKNLSSAIPTFNLGATEKDYATPEGEVGISLTPCYYFNSGKMYPPVEHRERVDRYKRNRKLFKGEHFEVFKDYKGSKQQQDLLYISTNIAGVICKKSADFLFGEAVQVKAGNGDSSPEQMAFDKFVDENGLNILAYESALANAYRGDSFFKVRYGQEYGGELPKELDAPRVIIEPVNPEHIFPEASIYNKNKIVAYHIAVPVLVEVDGEECWQLFVESHYAGRIEYRVYNISVLETRFHGGFTEVTSWKIEDEILEAQNVVVTGVPLPLIVHVPNLSTDDTWEGLDDISEHISIMDEINNRLTQIADILDKHSDPAMAVPSGILGEDDEGNPTFHVQRDKVFEVMGKEDVIPQYITWDGQLQQAFTELDKLVDLLLTTAEIPAVALGKPDGGGTSGTSGLAIKWRMNNLLAKINRKRQYYTKGLKDIFVIAQLLEQAVGIADYALTVPQLVFQDGLPKDNAEEATVMNIRTGGAKTLSQKSAIMRMEGMTEEQAQLEIERINEEAQQAVDRMATVDGSIFNDTSTHAEGSPVTDEANQDLSKTGTKKDTTGEE
ncbi:MAG: phage portal protein [Clostridium sp.]|uniref:phage portal protein n=1 Tax=Clostridium sp. TaxID=1506 RepID=UPI0039E7B27A